MASFRQVHRPLRQGHRGVDRIGIGNPRLHAPTAGDAGDLIWLADQPCLNVIDQQLDARVPADDPRQGLALDRPR